MIKKFT
jgi:hypothetical protein